MAPLGLLPTSRHASVLNSNRSMHLVYIALVLLFLGMYTLWTGQFVPHPSHATAADQSRTESPVTEPQPVNQQARDPPEIWAQGPKPDFASPLLQVLDQQTVQELKALCGRGKCSMLQ